MSMRKLFMVGFSILAIGLVGYGSLSFYTLQERSVETNASCAIGNSGTQMPRFACRWYLRHQLSNAPDSNAAQRAFHMAIGAYPTDKEGAMEIAELALAEGARINGHSPFSGYPPLHEAILLNEPHLVEFMLRNGADPKLENQSKELTATALLEALEQQNPSKISQKSELGCPRIKVIRKAL